MRSSSNLRYCLALQSLAARERLEGSLIVTVPSWGINLSDTATLLQSLTAGSGTLRPFAAPHKFVSYRGYTCCTFDAGGPVNHDPQLPCQSLWAGAGNGALSFSLQPELSDGNRCAHGARAPSDVAKDRSRREVPGRRAPARNQSRRPAAKAAITTLMPWQLRFPSRPPTSGSPGG